MKQKQQNCPIVHLRLDFSWTHELNWELSIDVVYKSRKHRNAPTHWVKRIYFANTAPFLFPMVPWEGSGKNLKKKKKNAKVSKQNECCMFVIYQISLYIFPLAQPQKNLGFSAFLKFTALNVMLTICSWTKASNGKSRINCMTNNCSSPSTRCGCFSLIQLLCLIQKVLKFKTTQLKPKCLKFN